MEIPVFLDGVAKASFVAAEGVTWTVFTQCSSLRAQLGSELRHAEFLGCKQAISRCTTVLEYY